MMDIMGKTAARTNDGDAWLDDYFGRYKAIIAGRDVYPALRAFHELAVRVRNGGGQLFFAGNGASASIASHGAVDFTKQGRVRSRDFNEPNLITCFANDFGYDNWMAKAIEFPRRSRRRRRPDFGEREISERRERGAPCEEPQSAGCRIHRLRQRQSVARPWRISISGSRAAPTTSWNAYT
ncbi:MAG: hypothetical protein WDN03_09350 [Rhizomicrobium sp.]